MEEYFGRYCNMLDSKGRINMPARFREMIDKYLPLEEGAEVAEVEGEAAVEAAAEAVAAAEVGIEEAEEEEVTAPGAPGGAEGGQIPTKRA